MQDKKVENLLVYKKTYEFLKIIYEQVTYFPKAYKYTLGEQIKKELLAMLVKIYETNSLPVQNRSWEIDIILSNLKSIEIMLHLCRDLKIISLNKFIPLSSNIIEIRKILYGWKKQTI